MMTNLIKLIDGSERSHVTDHVIDHVTDPTNCQMITSLVTKIVNQIKVMALKLEQIK